MPKINIPFISIQDNRTHLNTKDGYIQNCFIEKGAKLYLVKRPGVYKILTFTGTAGIARGWIYSSSHSKYYIVVGAKLYWINNGLSAITEIVLATPLSSTTSPVFFTQAPNGANQSVMLQQPGSTGQLYEIVNGAPPVGTLVADVDLITSNMVGAPVTLDTTLYKLTNTSSTTTIQGSDLSNPTSWTALNVINAYLYPDFGVTLAKFRNQIVVFKNNSTELFFNASNPTGSPLSRIPEAAFPVGCAVATSVVAIDNDLIWMSKDQNGGLGFHLLGANGLEKISSWQEDRILTSVEAIVNTGVVQATYLSFEGHKFYIISIDGTVPNNSAIPDIAIPDLAIPDSTTPGTSSFSRTLVYDVSTKHWAEWSSTTASGTQSSFFASFCISGSSVSDTKSYSNAVLLDKSTGDIYEVSPTAIGSANPASYQDIRAIQVKIVSNKLDGGTRNRKKMRLLEILGDTDNNMSTLSVRYSDDDYKTWSTPRTVDLVGRAFLPNLGMFRNRAFEFTHTDNKTLRLEAFEVDVELMAH